MIDFHTHLDLYPNAVNLLKKTNEINRFTLAVTTSPRAWLATSKVFSGYKNIEVGLGLHPEIVDEKFDELEFFLSSIPQVKFIGEIGIDGSARFSKSLQKQEIVFESVVRECQKVGGRIMSIHSRAATSKVLSILSRYPHAGKSILHWFTGTATELSVAIDMRCMFSINSVMLKSKKGRALVSRIPKNLILPESDGPFNKIHNRAMMPWEAFQLKGALSEIWHLSDEKIEEQLNENLSNLLSC
ncbi:MAG: hydrolase TatD [Candidatus Electrothrix sp. AUS1_2]|nr:hydrolase TatD [Candidatus Electrothrix sp. AUS1_2]